MTKHYILSLDPNARYEWDRCTLRDPISAAHPALADLVAEAIAGEPGSYLVAINIEVKVLEKAPAESGDRLAPNLVEVPHNAQRPQLAELVA
ncbi:hypothetical protein K9N68_19170 [Kovacikia minuta CCNUW1]|uniref:hypothetical protein n=1 Tax=Kovacikia minuta TaxID=2931930 RepID=UPI001CCA7B91|nr:hypothetical protein [Kovacikia minuta]UBF23871.1 hypothetical protein K9N68_19170 [Kovacikia minuta CCNUW1]